MNQIRIKNTAGKKHIAKYEITDFEGKIGKEAFDEIKLQQWMYWRLNSFLKDMQERDVVSLFSEVTLEVLLELGWKFVGFDQVEYVTSALEHEFMKQMKDVSSYPRPSSQYTPLTVPKNEHNKHMQIGKGNGSSHMNVQNAYRYHFCSMWSAHQRTEKYHKGRFRAQEILDFRSKKWILQEGKYEFKKQDPKDKSNGILDVTSNWCFVEDESKGVERFFLDPKTGMDVGDREFDKKILQLFGGGNHFTPRTVYTWNDEQRRSVKVILHKYLPTPSSLPSTPPKKVRPKVHKPRPLYGEVKRKKRKKGERPVGGGGKKSKTSNENAALLLLGFTTQAKAEVGTSDVPTPLSFSSSITTGMLLPPSRQASETSTISTVSTAVSEDAMAVKNEHYPQAPTKQGDRVRVWWPDDSAWYSGTVTSEPNDPTGSHHPKIKYDDGMVEDIKRGMKYEVIDGAGKGII